MHTQSLVSLLHDDLFSIRSLTPAVMTAQGGKAHTHTHTQIHTQIHSKSKQLPGGIFQDFVLQCFVTIPHLIGIVLFLLQYVLKKETSELQILEKGNYKCLSIPIYRQ